MQSKGPWSRGDIDRFLEHAQIPVRLAVNGASGHPVLASLWYLQQGDKLWCATQRGSSIAASLARDPGMKIPISGIGGISEFSHALNFILLGCGTVQVCTAAMLDHAVGPNVIKRLMAGLTEFLDKNSHRGWRTLEDFRGRSREKVVGHSHIRRPEDSDYHGGYEAYEGYAEPAEKR